MPGRRRRNAADTIVHTRFWLRLLSFRFLCFGRFHVRILFDGPNKKGFLRGRRTNLRRPLLKVRDLVREFLQLLALAVHRVNSAGIETLFYHAPVDINVPGCNGLVNLALFC